MRSPHAEQWRATLRKQYQVAVRSGDNVSGMTIIMERAGFREDELSQLRVMANIDNTDIEPDFDEAREAFGITEDVADDIDHCHEAIPEVKHEPKAGMPRIPRPRKGGA